MARRPSTVSLSSLSSSTATGLSKLAQLPPLTHSVSQNSNTSGEGSSQWLPNRKVSVSGSLKSSFEPNGYSDNLDPDELFAKHTVAEVRAIQQRLRVDADAKQQELRLMVGERYRDLLQASTSIIEIAQSSVNVKDAFQEMRNVSASMRQAHLPKSSTVAGDEDIYLHALQSLSAHMKLLLDAPEHLWRLIEKRRYLHAAWLFLLSRVVHQALLVAEDDEDAQWSAYGILVPEQFPLVQRQWDIVSQFRTQVTHKATLFLREHTLSSSDACAALLTLHLLESRPLPETVTIFLTQRTRALTTLLNRSRSIANGAADANLFTDAGPRRTSKASTLGTARTIFLGGALHPTSLMAEVLNYISTEAPPPDWVPHDLRFTTQTLLASLPSSTHYGLLPSNIKGYKPYIDDNTISTSKIHVQVEEQMQDWFRDALQDLEKAVDNWLSELKTIREVWYLRSQLRTWVDKGEGLVHDEKLQFTSTVENWCQKRTRQIWRSEIDAAKLAFQERLASTLESDRDSLNLNLSERIPSSTPAIIAE
ncbi:hypothetical protein EUX98_g755 [Antrodiella citrinella]|uniref:Conserved oligomeric Golgi complex subunit 1 n=1 Tax=Antrodiella citrinella TaxID=2447956 RepID=A0A4S4N356_9APHY|nr:hypothetical protein EUX98_g755 [Antrodiella citrinella]